ncbi:MAG TPA: hypothetical protein VFY39_15105 [Gammaproteobacteria bacterium]|nr:hypothetical protein [Gammaproteobacteria bacterium]
MTTIPLRAKFALASGVLMLVLGASAPAYAGDQVQLLPGIPNIDGTWERYRAKPGDPGAPPREAQAPMKPNVLSAWQARQAARRAADARGQPLITHNAYCLPDGMPGMMAGPFPFEILQSPGQVTIVQEAYNQIRRIYLDKPQAAMSDIELGYYGHSVGRWNSDGVLSVDTIGIKDYVRFRDVPHTPQMHISERLRLVTADILWDEVTITDPAVLTQPWTVTFAYKRLPGYEILEYICEDNRERANDNGELELGLSKQQPAAPAGTQPAGEKGRAEETPGHQ